MIVSQAVFIQAHRQRNEPGQRSQLGRALRLSVFDDCHYVSYLSAWGAQP